MANPSSNDNLARSRPEDNKIRQTEFAGLAHELVIMATETKTETIVLTGASGRKYTFYVYPWGASFKAAGGVYAVLREANNAGARSYHVVYIGQTGDLSTRHDNHHKEDCFRQQRATHIAAFVENNEQARLDAEADLIKAYNPPCNG